MLAGDEEMRTTGMQRYFRVWCHDGKIRKEK